jgi:hypothetical protein
MADPLIKPYEVTTNDVKILVSPTATMDVLKQTVAISFTYLINSFTVGSYAVKHRLTPEGGSAGNWLNSTITQATVSTNAGVLKAKNRKVRSSLTWETFKDALPLKYSKIEVRVYTQDGSSVSETLPITDMGAQDLRVNIVNAETLIHGSGTTPTFSFQCPKALKSYKVTPILEYGTTSNLSAVDHSITAFQYHNGTAYVAGDATNGNAVATNANLKLKMTASTAMGGTEYWRVRLVPVAFV